MNPRITITKPSGRICNFGIWYCLLSVIWDLCIGIFIQGCSSPATVKGNQVCFRNRCVDVEVVQTPDELMRGLQFRGSLDLNSGMLFIFPQSRRHSFWMKDTLIPLDMIWMDHGRKIVHIEHGVPPCRQDPCPVYTPPQAALYVLEVNAGYAATLGLQLGDGVEFKIN